MATQYRYEPLDAARQEIRIFMLQPSSVFTQLENMIIGKFKSVFLKDVHKKRKTAGILPYETISYVWGDASIRADIRVNGALLNVPKSSEEVLRRFRCNSSRRKKNSARAIWIDAVCINQADDDERSQQVALMGDIYRNGQENQVYLGESDDDTLDAICHIRWLCDVEIANAVKTVQSLTLLTMNNEGHHLRDYSPLWLAVNQKALGRLYFKPWFRRLWVLQEVVFARKTTCRCGDVVISMVDVLLVAHWLCYKSNFLEHDLLNEGLMSAGQMFSYMPTIHSTVGSGRFPSNIFSLLSTAQEQLCSDSRDKVFAILGLIESTRSPAKTPALVPDYSKNLADVLTSVTVFAIEEDKRYAVNSFLARISHRSNADIHIDGLPSWVPRWHREIDRFNDGRTLIAYPAPDHSIYSSRVQYLETLGESPRLLVSGFKIDAVDVIFPTSQASFSWPNFRTDYIIPSRDVFHSIGIDCMRPLSRLLTLDRDADDCFLCDKKLDEGAVFLSRLWRTTPDDYGGFQNVVIRMAFSNACAQRRVGKTEGSRPALLPLIATKGDIIVQLFEVEFPTVLRPRGDDYEVIGQAYVHGIMDNKAFADWKERGDVEEVFSLI